MPVLPAVLLLALAAAPPAPPPVAEGPRTQLLLVGTFHFKDAGKDGYKPQHAVDVLSAERQLQVEDLLERFARFRPTRIAVERKAEKQAKLDRQYQDYLAGRFELTENEIHQLGFRLAKRLGHTRVYAVDAPPPPAFKPVFERLQKVPDAEVAKLDPELSARFKALYAHDDALKTRQSLREHLRYLNSPERLRVGHGAYTTNDFKLEGDDGYLGADVGAAWYARNLRIFRNLQRLGRRPRRSGCCSSSAQGHVPILRFVAQSSARARAGGGGALPRAAAARSASSSAAPARS